jgi:tetratricopeptide (TPR) repeat protein
LKTGGDMKKIIFIFLLLPMFTIAQTPRQFLSTGKQLIDSAQYQQAVVCFSKAIAINPKYSDAYYLRAIAKKNTGDYEGAEADFTEVINLKPDDLQGYYQRALIREIRHDYKGAAGDYTTIIGFNPDNVRAYMERARVDSTAALTISDYAKAKDIDPAQLYLSRARLDWNNKNYTSCIDDYNALIALDPRNIIAYANRGSAKWELKDYEGAVNDYKIAISFNGKYTWTYYNTIGLIREDEKDFKHAIAAFSKSISLYPAGPTHQNRALAELAIGDYDASIKDFTVAIDSQYHNRNNNFFFKAYGADSYVLRAKAEMLNGAFKAAIADLDIAISINPALVLAYNARGEAKNKVGDDAGACADWQTANKMGCEPAKENLEKFCSKR